MYHTCSHPTPLRAYHTKQTHNLGGETKLSGPSGVGASQAIWCDGAASPGEQEDKPITVRAGQRYLGPHGPPWAATHTLPRFQADSYSRGQVRRSFAMRVKNSGGGGSAGEAGVP